MLILKRPITKKLVQFSHTYILVYSYNISHKVPTYTNIKNNIDQLPSIGINNKNKMRFINRHDFQI